MSVVLIALMSDAAGGHLMLLTLSLGHLSRSLLLVRYSQRFVIGIDDEDSQEACRVPVTGILTDPVMRAGPRRSLRRPGRLLRAHRQPGCEWRLTIRERR